MQQSTLTKRGCQVGPDLLKALLCDIHCLFIILVAPANERKNKEKSIWIRVK